MLNWKTCIFIVSSIAVSALAFRANARVTSQSFPTEPIPFVRPLSPDFDLMAYEEVQRCAACVYKAGGAGHSNFEGSAWIVLENGQARCEMWPQTRDFWRQTFKGNIPTRVIALIHSHPNNASERPSKVDKETSQNQRIPNFVVHLPKGIYVYNPDAKSIVNVRDSQFVQDITMRYWNSCEGQSQNSESRK